ncbi:MULTISPECIES: prepilin peptidase [Mammaliicoccus]|uniref:prepilin peptidase n=1 Tax=Mammaliicoccus TaxID=2803850 RepID=UPI001C4FC772|nr:MULTISPECIES: A24 family peptidase [Mammaliicoccus]MBW0761734.1 prepilin peptidase [Mammaliicoccus lentus]
MLLYFILGSILASYMYQLTSTTIINFKTLTCRSKCTYCNHKLEYKDLIPIFSYIYLKGKCRYCNTSIPKDLITVEILLSILFIMPLISPQIHNPHLYYFLIIFLIPLAIYDMKYYIVPNHILILMFITGILIFKPDIENILISLEIVFIIHTLYFLSKGGIGYGDVKLFCILCLILTWKQFLLIFMFTFIISGISAISYILFKKSIITKVPLVPYIAISSISVCIFNNQLLFYFLGG